LLLAREANVVVRDATLAQALQDSLVDAMSSGAVRVDPQAFLQRGWWQCSIDMMASWVLRFGVFLTGKRY
jgi:cardiolipin synthase